MHASRLSSVVFVALSGAQVVYCQQFPMGKQSYDAMGLSTACTAVLNTELTRCSSLLFHRTDRTIDNIVKLLPRSELDQICQPGCRQDLAALREKIFTTCTSPEDVMRDSGLKFPPVVFADKFAYTYDVVCHKHKTTGRLCNEVWREWSVDETTFDSCDDCYLGLLAIQLASPIGVSVAGVAEYNKTISACSGTSYLFTTATRYARPDATLKAAAALMLASAPCERPYTVQAGDNCNSIALAQNTSTYDLAQTNALDINCAVLPEKGRKLCLSQACHTYIIQSWDTCEDIARRFSISEDQFRALNPMIDPGCANIGRWKGYVACVGPASIIPAAQPDESKTARTPRATTTLKPLAPGSSSKCIEFVNGRAATDPDFVDLVNTYPSMANTLIIQDSNRCHIAAGDNGITTFELKRLNPILMEGSCNLEGIYSYCVVEEGGPLPIRDEFWDRQYAQRWG